MRFVCDSCRAQYMISDDKVGPKGVKIRCKKCGHTILVRPAGEPSAKEAAAENVPAKTPTPASGTPKVADTPGLPASLGTPPEGGLFTGVEEDEIGAVFDQVLSSGSHKIPPGESVGESPKDAASETVRRLAEAEEAGPSKDDAKSNAASHEWYVAVEEKQVGPWSVEKVKDAWDRGEVGPDSLCWRAGFSDWIPLSEATELATVLAPRPSKPVIVAPAPVSTSSPTIPSGPVESAFSAGSSKSGRGEGLLGGGAPASPDEAVGWKPSAASVLASLVKEEDEALSKPPPRPAPSLEREPVSQSRLLDVPMPPPEPVSSPGAPAGMMMAPAPVAAAPAPYAPPAPAYAQPMPAPYAQPAPGPYAQPAPGYPQPGYPPAYAPPAAPANKGRTGLLVAAVAGVLVIAGAAVVYVARGGERAPETPVQTPAQVAQAPSRAATELPMPPPPAGTVQAPPAATQQPAAVAAAAPGTPTPAPAPGTPGTAPGTAPAAATTAPVAAGTPAPATATAPAAATTAPVATPPPAANPGTAVAAAPTTTPPPTPATSSGTAVARVERKPIRSGSSGGRSGSQDEAPSRPAASASSSSSSGDDDFDELFGTKKPASTPKAETKAPTTYIPPEPGGSTPERLQQSDIMQVVLSNKPAIVKCVNEQKKKDPSLSGKLVMRWTIQTSGKTSAVACRTDEFRSSYMASCISGLIKGWTFPRHKKQGDPIDFPFTF